MSQLSNSVGFSHDSYGTAADARSEFTQSLFGAFHLMTEANGPKLKSFWNA